MSTDTIVNEIEIEAVNLTADAEEITGTYLLTQAPTEIDYLIQGLLPRTGMAALVGASDLGKSMCLRQLAIWIAGGSPSWLGFELKPKHGSVICACSEDDQHAVGVLLHKQAVKFEPEQLERLRFLFVSEVDELFTELDRRLTDKPADLVIIDCFSDVYFGDLKDTSLTRQFLNQYLKLISKHQCFVLFLHHTGKRTENLEPSKNNILSGQGFEAKMRLIMELRKDFAQPEFRHLCIVKGNYLPHRMKSESFVLQFCEDDFNFINTGERVPFEMLVKSADDPGKAKYQQAKELHDKGHNYEKIAELLGYASKGSISKLFDKAKQKGWGQIQ